jgi:TonB family protein
MKALCCVVVLILFLGVGCNNTPTAEQYIDYSKKKFVSGDYTQNDTSDVEGIYLVDIDFEHPETMPSVNLEELQKKLIYPKIAIRAKIEGRVIVLVYINDKGEPLQPKIIGSTNMILEEASIDVIKKTKFKPATQFNKPIGAFLEVPIEFKLKDAE